MPTCDKMVSNAGGAKHAHEQMHVRRGELLEIVDSKWGVRHCVLPGTAAVRVAEGTHVYLTH